MTPARLPLFAPSAALRAHPCADKQPPSADAGCRHDRTEACAIALRAFCWVLVPGLVLLGVCGVVR